MLSFNPIGDANVDVIEKNNFLGFGHHRFNGVHLSTTIGTSQADRGHAADIIATVQSVRQGIPGTEGGRTAPGWSPHGSDPAVGGYFS